MDIRLDNEDNLSLQLKSDQLDLDLSSMIDTQEVDIQLEQDIAMDIQMGDDDTMEIKLIDGVPMGTNNYNDLDNKPSINGVTLVGDKTFEQLGRDDIKNSRIKEIIDTQYELIFGGN